MAIVMTLDKHDFADAFKRYNRQDNFSHEGLEVLFDYLDQISDDTGEPIELDVVGLCCEYYESSTEELIESYNIEIDLDSCIDAQDQDEVEEIKREAVREYLEKNTSVCGEVVGGFVYAAF